MRNFREKCIRMLKGIVYTVEPAVFTMESVFPSKVEDANKKMKITDVPI